MTSFSSAQSRQRFSSASAAALGCALLARRHLRRDRGMRRATRGGALESFQPGSAIGNNEWSSQENTIGRNVGSCAWSSDPLDGATQGAATGGSGAVSRQWLCRSVLACALQGVRSTLNDHGAGTGAADSTDTQQGRAQHTQRTGAPAGACRRLARAR